MAIKSQYNISKIKIGCSCSMPGVWQAVAHNEGAAVIFHSPKGCGHIARKMEIGRFYRSLGRKKKPLPEYTAPLIISGLKEEHSIFGGSEMLAECIDYVMKKYQPLYVLIANSCVSGVIGDDLNSVAAEAENKWQKPILTVTACGFLNGNYQGGYYDAAVALLERFAVKQERKADKVAVLGDLSGPYGEEMQELKRLLAYFNLEVHCYFPSYASLAVMDNLTASRCSFLSMGTPLTIAGNKKLGRIIEKQFGVDFFPELPIASLAGIENWLTKLGKYLGEEELAAKAINEEKKRLEQSLHLVRDKLKKKRGLLFLGRSLAYLYPEWILEVINLSGIKLSGIVLADGFTVKQQEEIRAVFSRLTDIPIVAALECDDLVKEVDVFLATEELKDLGKIQFVLPMIPPVGMSGLIELLQKMSRIAAKRRAGVIYG